MPENAAPSNEDVINVGPVLAICVALGFAIVLFGSIALGIMAALWWSGLL